MNKKTRELTVEEIQSIVSNPDIRSEMLKVYAKKVRV